MGMRLDQGGHLTHGSPVNFSGRIYDFVAYGVDDETETLDYDEIRDLAKAERPKAIIAGATAYSRIIDFAAFRSHRRRDRRAAHRRRRAHRRADRRRRAPVAGPARRRRHVHHAQDAARPAGRLRSCAASEHADGDRQGRVPGPAGRPADARDRGEGGRVPPRGRSPSSREYAAQIVRNAAALAGGLADEGFRIVSGGTDNHLMLVDLRPFGVTGKVAQEALDRAGITCNKNAIPNDPEKPFVTSGLRLGTAVGHDGGHGRAGDGGDRAPDRRGAAGARRRRRARRRARRRPTASARKFTPYPELEAGR